MGALADEYVAIRADTSYLAKDLKKQGKKSGDNLGKGILGGMKGILGPVSGILAGLGVLTFLKDASEAARESMKIGKQTQAVLKSTGGVAKITAKQIEGMASRLSHLTGVDDEVIQSGENMLLTFTNIRNDLKKGNMVFDEATAIMLDMSVALGQDTKSSAMQLGKALNDPVKGVSALQRVGVTFTQKQKDVIKHLVKTGKTAEAQEVILAELRKEFGGSAEAQATWVDKMKVAFGDVQEIIGGFLNKVLEPVAKWFTDVGLPAIKDFFDRISKDKAIKTAITNLKDALTTLTGDVDFRQSLTDIADALPKIIDGIATVVRKIDWMRDKIIAFEEATKPGGPADLGAGPYLALKALVTNIGVKAAEWDAKITGWVEGLRDKIAKIKINPWNVDYDGINRKLGEWIAGIQPKLDALSTSVIEWVKTLWDDVETETREGGVPVDTETKSLSDRIIQHFKDMHLQIPPTVREMWRQIRGSFTISHTLIGSGDSRFWNTIKKHASDAMGRVKTAVKSDLADIARFFGAGAAAIGRAWSRVKSVVAAPIAFVINTVLEKGILKAFRDISSFVNYGPGKNVHVGWNLQPTRQGGTAAGLASGGVLPGYTPGRDVHRFVSATGGVLDLSGGEGIARPEIVRALGKDRWDRMNAAAAHGRLSAAQGYLGGFASGGFLGGQRPVPAGSTNRHSGYPWATWAGDLGAGMNTPVRAWKAGIIAAVRYLTTSYGRHIIENVGGARAYYAHLARAVVSPGQTVSQGQLIGYSDSTGNSTGPHLHFEIRGGNAAVGAGISGGGGGIDAGKYLSQVTAALAKLKGIGAGQFGQMIAAAARLIGDKVKGKISEMAAAATPTGANQFTAIGGGNNRAIGKRMMLQRWGAGEWPALNSLWTKESGWRTTARNPSSGAYGIPQSLPGSKMASAGSDWRTNPATQIKWGLGYIASRYGSPSSAWRHSQRTNWYGNGGLITEPVIGMGMRSGQRYGFGEHGTETVTPGRGGRGINIYVDLGEGLVRRVEGILDEHDEFHASVGRMHR